MSETELRPDPKGLNAIIYRMEEKAITRRKLAEYLGVDPSRVTRWFTSSRLYMPPERVEKLAEVLEWDIDTIFRHLAAAHRAKNMISAPVAREWMRAFSKSEHLINDDLTEKEEATVPDKTAKDEASEPPAEPPQIETTEYIIGPKGRQYTLATVEGSARVQATIEVPPTSREMPHAGDLLRLGEEFLLKIECTLKTNAANNGKNRGGR
jgi:transcriptional regulator with XRE-family HTH domain